MSRYFFHLNFLRHRVCDEEGTELPDLGAAKKEASGIIRDLAADYLRGAREFDLHSVDIQDHSGAVLAEVLSADALTEVIVPDILKNLKSDSRT